MKLWKRGLAVLMTLFLLVPTMPKGYGVVFAEEAETEEEAQYTVTFSANGGMFDGEILSLNEMFYEGEYVRVPSQYPTREGYEFKGWSLDPEDRWGNDFIEDEQVHSDITYYAAWDRVYTITFDANGGTFYEDSIKTYTGTNDSGGAWLGEQPQHMLSRYQFLGWAEDQSATVPTLYYDEEGSLTVPYERDVTYYAVWEDTLVDVQELVLGQEALVSYDGDDWTMYAFTAPEDGVYYFISHAPEDGDCNPIGYLEDSESSIASNDNGYDSVNFMIRHEMNQGDTVYLKSYDTWNDLSFYVSVTQGNEVTVTAHAAPGHFADGSQEKQFTCLEGANVCDASGEYPDHDDPHYQFWGWGTVEDEESPSWTIPASEGLHIYAKWRRHCFLTFYPGENGYFLDENEERYTQYQRAVYADDETAVYYKDEFETERYQVYNEDPSLVSLGWSTDPDASEPLSEEYIYMAGEDIELYAVWATGIKVTLDPQGGEINESTEPIELYVKPGSTVRDLWLNGYKYIDDERYGLLGWATTENATEPDVDDDFIISEDISLYAVWAPTVKVRLFGDEGEGVTIVVVGRAYDPQYFGDPSNEGEERSFVGWALDPDASSDALPDLIFTQDTIIYPIWRDPIQVTYITEYGYFDENGESECSIKYDPGAYFYSIGIYDYPEYLKRTAWRLEDGTIIDEDYQVNKSIVVYAVWAEPTTFITLHANGGCFEGDPDQTELKFYYDPEEVSDEIYIGRLYWPRMLDDSQVIIGWATTEDATEPEYEKYGDVPLGTTDLYAIWADAYVITFVSQDPEIGGWYDENGDIITSYQVAYPQNSFVNLWDTSLDHVAYEYSFIGWNLDKNASEYMAEVYVDEPLTVYAVFQNRSRVTFDLDGGYYKVYDEEAERYFTYTDPFTLYVDKDRQQAQYLAQDFMPGGSISYEKEGGYGLLGWSKEPNTTVEQFEEYINITEDEMTVYAVWDKTAKVRIHFWDEEGEEYTVLRTFYMSRTFYEQGLLYDEWRTDENGEPLFLVGYSTEKDGPVEYGPNDYIDASVTDLYEVWKPYTESGHPELALDQENSLTLTEDRQLLYAFTPDEDGVYAFKVSMDGCGFYDCRLGLDDYSYVDYYYAANSDDWNTAYIPLELEAGTRYYLRMQGDLWEEVETAEFRIMVQKAGKVVYHLNDEETQTEIVPAGRSPRYDETADPEDPAYAFAGWAESENATVEDIINVRQRVLSAGEVLDLYPVWETLGENAVDVSAGVSQSFSVDPKGTWIKFVPEESRPYVIVLKRNNEYASYGLYENDIKVQCYDDQKQIWLSLTRDHRSWNYAYILFTVSMYGFTEGNTYYYKLTSNNGEDIDLDICIEPAQEVYLNSNGGTFDSYHVHGMPNGEDVGYVFRGNGAFIEIPKPPEGGGKTFAGWSTDSDATEPNADLSGREDISWISFRQRFYAIWDSFQDKAVDVQLGEEKPVVLTSQYQYFAFTPLKTGNYALELEQQIPYTPSGQFWYQDGDLSIECIDSNGDIVRNERASSWHYGCDVIYEQFEAGQTYYFKISDGGNENNIASTLRVSTVKRVILDANGGTFEGIDRVEGFLFNGETWIGSPTHPQESTGMTFAGWATTPDATDVDVDLQDEESIARVEDGDTLYAVWKQGIKVTFKTDVGEWETYGASEEPVTELSIYYAPDSALWDKSAPHAINHPDGLMHGNTYQDADGNIYNWNTTVTQDVTLYPVWYETVTITYHAGDGFFPNSEDPTKGTEKYEKGIRIGLSARYDLFYKPVPNNESLTFAGWSLKENGSIEDIQEYFDLDSDIDLYPVYLKTIHVTARVNDPNLGKIASWETENDHVDTLQIETWEGARFDQLRVYVYSSEGCICDSHSRTKDESEPLSSDYRLKDGDEFYYIFARGYTVILWSEGGHWDDGREQGWASIRDGQSLKQAFDACGEPEYEGHCFDGWVLRDAEGQETPVYADTVLPHPAEGYVTLYAKWSDKPSISGAVVTLSKMSYTYNGKPCEPAVTVTLNGVALTTEEYDVEYSDNTNAGTATVTVKGKGEYGGKVIKTFAITKAKNTITQTKTYGKSYSTKAQTIQLAKTAKYESAGLTYKASNTKIKVGSTGKVTIPAKFSGKFTITITSKATANYASGAKATVTVYVPTKPTISSATNSASKTMLVKWKKATVASGYQVQYATSSKFKSAKTVTVKKQATVKATIKKLTKGKTYYVRVRSYYTVSSKNYYSAWSATKKVVIKK